MGWPKKNEEMRLYLEKKTKSYLLVFLGDEYRCPDGSQESVGELMIHNDPNSPKVV